LAVGRIGGKPRAYILAELDTVGGWNSTTTRRDRLDLETRAKKLLDRVA
jgi:hypothetical protein